MPNCVQHGTRSRLVRAAHPLLCGLSPARAHAKRACVSTKRRTIARKDSPRRDWRWSTVDLVLALVGAWVVIDGVSISAVSVFVSTNVGLAVAFASRVGRSWVHPTPWDLPVVLLGNLLILAWPLLLAAASASSSVLVACLLVLIGSRAGIAWCSSRHAGYHPSHGR